MATEAPLLIWINFNPSMDKKLIHNKVRDEIIYPFPNFSGASIARCDHKLSN